MDDDNREFCQSVDNVTLQMLKEMATAGVGMAVVVTAVWVGMVAIASGVEKKAAKEAEVKGLER